MKTWNEMTARERAAWAAGRIMGWPEVDGLTPLNGLVKFGGYIFDGRPERFIGIGFAHEEFCPRKASDDFLILKHIREHWTHEQNQAFVTNLGTIRWPRCNVSQPFSLELYAEPGDYSHAAYLTLNEL